MACVLPTPEKSWTYDFFTVTGTHSNANQSAIVQIKDMLVGTFGWTVALSNGWSTGDVHSGTPHWDTGAGDNWLGGTASVLSANGSGSRSWIVLQSPGGQQILWDNLRSQPSGLLAHTMASVYWSPLSDFTGGTSSARPTSPNESQLISRTGWFSGGWSGSQQSVCHIMQSTDNLHTRLFTFRAGVPHSKWFIDQLLDPVTSFAIPQISWMNRGIADGFGSSNNNGERSANYSTMHNAQEGLMRVTDGGVLMACSLACEGTVSDAVGERLTIADELTGCNPVLPTVVVSGTSGSSGVLGRIPDVWFGRANLVNATTFPGSGTHEFVQFSDVIVPWDGSLPQVT